MDHTCDKIPLGVFDDANMIRGNRKRFKMIIRGIKKLGFDSIMLANGDVKRDRKLFSVSDSEGIDVYYNPISDLFSQCGMQSRIASIHRELNSYRSMAGYYIADEPEADKEIVDSLYHISSYLHKKDSRKVITAVLKGMENADKIMRRAWFNVFLIDAYPCSANGGIGDFRMQGFGYPQYDFIDYIRLMKKHKPGNMPLWVIIQAHRLEEHATDLPLRQPVSSELRKQAFMAFGEGAKGLFWFAYTSQQAWTGLEDNHLLCKEAVELNNRLKKLRVIIKDCCKTQDEFSVSSKNNAQTYTSTLFDSASRKKYVMAVNRDCRNYNSVRIFSDSDRTELKDVENQKGYRMGISEIILKPGDGRIFEIQ